MKLKLWQFMIISGFIGFFYCYLTLIINYSAMDGQCYNSMVPYECYPSVVTMMIALWNFILALIFRVALPDVTIGKGD
jgi:hypothetical protein